ncbi:PREDICTED: NKG2D ligand 3-like isoform X2 [Capra hircus]|uniref:NKG2D ligand 3-like isoform X2 n=1 Tax=Capra hircus TaxID=9925 RepID=UPI00084639B8|nr:PREDICTED: NKG2D ligand 3-like isoform X2 [Capra hircus]
MDWKAGPGARLGFPALVLLVAPRFCTARGDPHSLSDVTIDPWPRDDQPRCEVQGEIDQKVFVSCDFGKGPLTLQARMKCCREDSGRIGASWEFGFKGQPWLPFNLDNGPCTVHHAGGRRMKRKRENDRAVTDCFKKVCKRDCRLCYQAFLVCWENTMASPTTGPPTVKSSATAIKHITWILPMLLTSFIITVFLG